MKTKSLALIGILTAFVSCYNESDLFPAFDDDCTWETTLDEIISDNDTSFGENHLKLIEAQVMKGMSIDSSLFFNGRYGYFPVFNKKDTIFEFIQYDEIDKENSEYSFDSDIVNTKINTILSNKEKYDIIQLTWQYNGESFNTLALFNKKTGELEYDNLLFNMPLISKYDNNTFSMMLRSTESNVITETGVESVSFIVNTITVATSTVDWALTGYWTTYDHIEDSVKYRSYTYHFLDITHAETGSHQNGYDHYNQFFLDTFFPGGPCKFRICVWAGTSGGFDYANYGNINDHPDGNIYSGPSRGNGYIKTITKRLPTRPDEVIEILFH